MNEFQELAETLAGTNVATLVEEADRILGTYGLGIDTETVEGYLEGLDEAAELEELSAEDKEKLEFVGHAIRKGLHAVGKAVGYVKGKKRRIKSKIKAFKRSLGRAYRFGASSGEKAGFGAGSKAAKHKKALSKPPSPHPAQPHPAAKSAHKRRTGMKHKPGVKRARRRLTASY